MSFYVTSANRNAIRKLIVGTGLHPATDVRNWPVAKLGAIARQLVTGGQLTEAACVEACKAEEAEIEFVPVPAAGVAPVAAEGRAAGSANALAAAIAAAVQGAVGEIPSGTDEAKVRAICAALIEEAQIRPAIIEIRTDGNVKAVDGRKHAAFENCLRIVSTRIQNRRLHAWLAGPSGSGKSHLAYQLAEAMAIPFYSTGAIQSKYDLIGFVSPTGAEATLRTPFRNAFENGGLFSWDDCDASDPRAFVAFNEALSNGRFAFPDKCVEQHSDFVAVASANTWGNGATSDYVGRNKIDAATLSRFVRIEVDYDEELERDLVGAEGRDWVKYVQRVRKAVVKTGVKVLITPRQSLQGAALLKAGMPREIVERSTLFAGVDRETEAKIRAAA